MDLTVKLDGRVCLVTGGASGMGREFAKALAGCGASVMIADLNAAGAEAAAAELRAQGLQADWMEVDAADAAGAERMAAEVKEKYGRIDVLVNSIGVGAKARPGEDKYQLWNRLIRINLCGVFHCCAAVGEVMVAQGKGAIINIASMSASIVPAKNRPGRLGEYGLFGYCASKGGVRQLTKAIAALWAEYGVRANSISPGYVDTPMTKEPHSDPVVRSRMEATVPAGHIAAPEEITGAVLFLASDASAYITGHDLLVDGGFTCR
ncbi:SDR family NAD(P)-dependent oxidoreductase [Oscillibacter sp.]|uniref:SDR family NAD(P)-dependent oxidoreductase n=1 Tax=Oscillibacter sp. TaxID=1945593 RepID=UPI002D801784|nr:SDR family oxidoreductase [Oscillibacter sp.]